VDNVQARANSARMTQYVYHPDGEAQGVILGNFIYDMKGAAAGRITGTRVYRLDGAYVGELFQEMIVEKPVGRRLALPPARTPQPIVPPRSTAPRRALAYEFPDAFHLLRETAQRSFLPA